MADSISVEVRVKLNWQGRLARWRFTPGWLRRLITERSSVGRMYIGERDQGPLRIDRASMAAARAFVHNYQDLAPLTPLQEAILYLKNRRRDS